MLIQLEEKRKKHIPLGTALCMIGYIVCVCFDIGNTRMIEFSRLI